MHIKKISIGLRDILIVFHNRINVYKTSQMQVGLFTNRLKNYKNVTKYVHPSNL